MGQNVKTRFQKFSKMKIFKRLKFKCGIIITYDRDTWPPNIKSLVSKMGSLERLLKHPKNPISGTQNTLWVLARPLNGSGPKSLCLGTYTMGTYWSMVQTQISYFFHVPPLFETHETPHLIGLYALKFEQKENALDFLWTWKETIFHFTDFNSRLSIVKQ